MSPNSQAYRDAWARAKAALTKELCGDDEVSIEAIRARLTKRRKVEYLLDDLAGVTVCAVLGIEPDSQ